MNKVLCYCDGMEDMDLVLLPKQRLADVNPESPNFAHASAK